MAKKMTRQDLETVVSNFTTQATRAYDSPAFAAGYLTSMLAGILANMPLKDQLHHVNILNSSSVWSKDVN